tara:strand:- start:5 stop:403 length:399 start_codon:yes stop_codon:yes gene_type:complete
MADTEKYEDFDDPDLSRSRPSRLAQAWKIRSLEKKLELMVKKYTIAGGRHKLAREAVESEMEALESEMEELRENCSFCYSCELDGRHYNEAARALLAPFSPDMTVREVLVILGGSGLEASAWKWCMASDHGE